MWIQTALEFNFLDSGKNSTKTWSQIQGHCTEQVEDFKAERYSDPGFTPTSKHRTFLYLVFFFCSMG